MTENILPHPDDDVRRVPVREDQPMIGIGGRFLTDMDVHLHRQAVLDEREAKGMPIPPTDARQRALSKLARLSLEESSGKFE